MLNVNELENRYKKYKLKSYTPFFATLLGVAVATIAVSFFLLYDFDSKRDLKSKQIVQKQEIKKEDYNASIIALQSDETNKEDNQTEEIVQEMPIIEEEVQTIDEKVLLSPSLDFIKNIKPQAPTIKEETIKTLVAVEQKREALPQKKESSAEKKDEILPPVIEEVKESITPVEKSSSIDIKRRDEEDDIKHVIKRFNINHNPALSLFVAKKYYQLEDYEQAYNYALATNELNNDIEASWIIFSKSLVKLGKKEMAIQTLREYIKQSNSSQAKQLLDEILSGKFR